MVRDRKFVDRILAETREHILPRSHAVNADMAGELRDLISLRELSLPLTGTGK